MGLARLLIIFAAVVCYWSAVFAGWHAAGLGLRLAVSPSWTWLALNTLAFIVIMIAFVREYWRGLPK